LNLIHKTKNGASAQSASCRLDAKFVKLSRLFAGWDLETFLKQKFIVVVAILLASTMHIRINAEGLRGRNANRVGLPLSAYIFATGFLSAGANRLHAALFILDQGECYVLGSVASANIIVTAGFLSAAGVNILTFGTDREGPQAFEHGALNASIEVSVSAKSSGIGTLLDGRDTAISTNRVPAVARGSSHHMSRGYYAENHRHYNFHKLSKKFVAVAVACTPLLGRNEGYSSSLRTTIFFSQITLKIVTNREKQSYFCENLELHLALFNAERKAKGII
jgi:hypothetical protein